MSYVKTEWDNGDIITAEKLNNAEIGIEEINMSYEKQTWSNGDTITAEKLNYMENGISGGGGGSSDFAVATVTVIPDGLPDGVGMAESVLKGLLYFPFYVAEEQSYERSHTKSQTGTFNILMYQNVARFEGDIRFVGTNSQQYFQADVPVCTGGIIYDEEEEIIIITGDGTITVPVGEN